MKQIDGAFCWLSRGQPRFSVLFDFVLILEKHAFVQNIDLDLNDDLFMHKAGSCLSICLTCLLAVSIYRYFIKFEFVAERFYCLVTIDTPEIWKPARVLVFSVNPFLMMCLLPLAMYAVILFMSFYA